MLCYVYCSTADIRHVRIMLESCWNVLNYYPRFGVRNQMSRRFKQFMEDIWLVQIPYSIHNVQQAHSRTQFKNFVPKIFLILSLLFWVSLCDNFSYPKKKKKKKTWAAAAFIYSFDIATSFNSPYTVQCSCLMTNGIG